MLGLVSLVACLFGVFFVVNLIPVKIAVGSDDLSPTVFKKVFEQPTYSSDFFGRYNGLNRVDVLFKNPNLESRDELLINVKDQGGMIVATQKFTGFNLGDTSQARVDFAPQQNSLKQSYSVEVQQLRIVDGKLAVGTKTKGLEVTAYYGSKLSIKGAWRSTLNIFKNVVLYQPIVILLPMLFLALFLW